MKKTPENTLKPSRLKAEIKRDSIILASLFLVVVLILIWKALIMPPLTLAFNGTENLAEINNLLMIVGSLAILCLMLAVVLIAVLLKMHAISTKLDSFHQPLPRTTPEGRTPDPTSEIENPKSEP